MMFVDVLRFCYLVLHWFYIYSVFKRVFRSMAFYRLQCSMCFVQHGINTGIWNSF